MSDPFLRLPDVIREVGYRKSQIYALINVGRFPRPTKLSPGKSVWRASTIEQWKSDREAACPRP